MKLQLLPWRDDTPAEGKVFAAVFPHSDDFVLSAGGLMLKLIHEGYTGYMIRVTDDCMDSYDLPYGQTSARIERETQQVASLMGIEKVYSLNYNNHYLDGGVLTELRHRLILLLRFLKVDTVITFDPYGHYEENPDHEITGKAVEHAAWMAGRPGDLPETKEMGIPPYFVKERYYVARGPQESNCIVDTELVQDQLKAILRQHRTPLDCMWKGYVEKCGPIAYEAFVDRFFLQMAPQPEMGLSYYEKYRYVEACGF